jgi:hypothetical protein
MIRRLLIRLGFRLCDHHWERWGEPKPAQFSEYGQFPLLQHRWCTHCGKTQQRQIGKARAADLENYDVRTLPK